MNDKPQPQILLSNFKKGITFRPFIIGLAFIVVLVGGLLTYQLFLNKPIPEILLTCPTIKSFCTQTGIYKESSISGSLKNGEVIYAAFDGTVDQLVSSQPKKTGGHELYNVLFLTSQDKKLKGLYMFKGTPTVKEAVKKGTVIATSSGQVLSFVKDNPSFVFKLIKISGGEDYSELLSLERFK